MSHHPLPVADHVVPAWAVADSATILSETSGQVPLRLDRAPRWSLLVTNGTGDEITALRVRFQHRAGGAWSPWEAVSSGLPLADGATLRVNDTYGQGVAAMMDVEVTAAAAGDVALDLMGT